MRILLVGSDGWAVAQAERRLDGHDVLRCHAEGAPAFPCARFGGGRCPVDDGVEATVLVRGRISHDLQPGELGAVCSLRAGVPVVAAGLVEGSPFAELVTATVEPGGDLAAVAEAVAVVDVRTG